MFVISALATASNVYTNKKAYLTMNFKTWLEADAGNSGFPQSFPINRGTSTPASGEVQRTGLQPQVDSHEIHTDEKDEQDKILAIDGAIKRADSEMPQGKQDGSQKLTRFKNAWEKFKAKWEDLKLSEDEPDDEVETDGLASMKGDENMVQMMQQNPNALATGPNQSPVRVTNGFQ